MEIRFVSVGYPPKSKEEIAKFNAESDIQEAAFMQMEEMVARLRRNLEQYPREVLQTKYKAGYERLTDAIMKIADEWARWLWRVSYDGLPRDPQDATGNAEMERVYRNVIGQTQWRNGARERYRAALIDRLDVDEFVSICDDVDRVMREKAFRPYWQSHCHTTEDGQIFNDVYRAYWQPTPKSGSGGYWAKDGYINPCFPP